MGVGSGPGVDATTGRVIPADAVDSLGCAVCTGWGRVAHRVVVRDFEGFACLRSGVLVGLGRISYSLYLVHITLLPLRDTFAGWFARIGTSESWGLAVTCTAGLALCLAGLSWWFVEGVGRMEVVRRHAAGSRQNNLAPNSRR